VAKPGAQMFIATWGDPERCESVGYLAALKALLPEAAPHTPGPFALSRESALRRFVGIAGLRAEDIVDVEVPFEYPNLDAALRGLLATGPAVRAIQIAGRVRVTQDVAETLVPFKLPNGGYRMRNQFKLVVASRPA
jgi:hypothetical protein